MRTKSMNQIRQRNMQVDENDYFEERAEAEIKLAQQAQHPAAVKAHCEMAGLYLDRIHGTDSSAKGVDGQISRRGRRGDAVDSDGIP